MKETKGITIIALIITIVVMLILAGLGINLIINSNVIGTAKRAKTETANSVAGDQNTVDYFKNKIRETDEDYGDSTIAVTGVYPILYDNGELAFNTTNQESLTGTRTSVVKKYGDISNANWTAAAQNLWNADGNNTSITTVTFEDRVAPTSTAYWFYSCSNLTTFNNMKNLKTANVTNMSHMFRSCSSLTSLDLSKFDTSKVTTMQYMFNACSNLTSLDISNFDTSKVTTMYNMYNGCSSLTSLDVSHFDTSKVTYMGYMFSNCSGLTSLDVSNFDTSKVTDMKYMFGNCDKLTNLDVSHFSTSNVTDMKMMFYNCKGLTSIDVSNFNTAKVEDMGGMFSLCSKLTSLNLNNFNTKKVTTMTYTNSYDVKFGMIQDCTNLSAEITISGNVNEYDSMFLGAAKASGAQITVNYTAETESLVDAMIATKSNNSNVVKGTLKVVE